jgi:molybdopterin converting factor small subunit
MTQVRLHYWAGARAAAGVEHEVFDAPTVAAALASATGRRTGSPDDQQFAKVLAACSLLVDGRALHPADLERQLSADTTVEVLPPFAGG